MTAAFSAGSGSPLSFGGIRPDPLVVSRSTIKLSSGLPGAIGVSFSPPFIRLAKVVMSSFPLCFLASWQAKQFSLRIGATSLMKLTGPFGAWAKAVDGRPNRSRNSSASPRTAQRMQKR